MVNENINGNNNAGGVMKVGESRTFGNYRVCHKRGGDGKWVVCTSVSGDWKVSWRDDSWMYGVMLMLTRDDKKGDFTESLIHMFYISTAYPHDLESYINRQTMPFREGMIRLVDEQNQYLLSLVKPVSRKADERMLEEAVEMERLREDLNDLIDDERNG